MRKTLAIIIKDTLLRFTNPVEWLFFLLLPIVFIVVLSGGTGAPSDSRLRLMVVDQANSSLSASLLAELENSPTIRPVPTELKPAMQEFDSRQIAAILIIPADFTTENLQSRSAKLELRQQKNNLNALVHQQAVQGAITKLSSLVDVAVSSTESAESISPFNDENSRQAYFQEAFTAAQQKLSDVPARLEVDEGKTPDQVPYDPRANSTAGQMITWVFIPLIGLSAMFAMERVGGTLRRVLVTPTSKYHYLGSTVLGQVLTAVLQMTLLILFGALVMKVNWGKSLLALAMVMLCSAAAAASLGVMVGTFVKTEDQANGLSIMVGMVLALMGGCWYPMELFPQVFRTIAQAFPTYWAMQGFLDISVRGQGVQGILLECAILAGFAVVFLVVGVWRFKFE